MEQVLEHHKKHKVHGVPYEGNMAFRHSNKRRSRKNQRKQRGRSPPIRSQSAITQTQALFQQKHPHLTSQCLSKISRILLDIRPSLPINLRVQDHLPLQSARCRTDPQSIFPNLIVLLLFNPSLTLHITSSPNSIISLLYRLDQCN